jgi:trimeric autotransporter adhesin
MAKFKIKSRWVVLFFAILFLGLSGSSKASVDPVLLSDIHPGSGSNPQYLKVVGDQLFFVADDGVNGPELWVSDGTSANMVKNIAPQGTIFTPTNLTEYNGLLYFNANDGASGQELWVSDGTEIGTVMLKDIYPGGDSNPTRLTISNGLLYFPGS